MKRALYVLILMLWAFVIAFIQTGCTNSPSPEELKASIEIIDVETKWVSKYYQPWPPKLTLVPAISFKVKNVTDKPLRYINFNAIFRLRDDSKNLGDRFLAAIRGEPVMPGETSDNILLASNFGFEGKSLSHFKNNPYWKTVLVKLFVQSKGSQYTLLGEWEINKKIDFKEPEPVGIKKKEGKVEKKE